MTEAEAERCRHMKSLRLALKIPRAHFATLIGISSMALYMKERGLARFRNAEVAQIKSCVAKHLADAQAALAALESL